ncbi:hypothetical protein KCU88_g189, partial [Aureobasidium melanogenum]
MVTVLTLASKFTLKTPASLTFPTTLPHQCFTPNDLRLLTYLNIHSPTIVCAMESTTEVWCIETASEFVLVWIPFRPVQPNPGAPWSSASESWASLEQLRLVGQGVATDSAVDGLESLFVGEALLLPGELLPPSLADFANFAELYRKGTGKGGGLLLSKEPVVDWECDDR